MPHLSHFPEVQPSEGVIRQVLSENELMMVVSFRFERGAIGARHSHPHVQSTYVEAGRFLFSIGNNAFEVQAGDSFVIPSNAEHECTCLESGRLIDCFTPRREDFL